MKIRRMKDPRRVTRDLSHAQKIHYDPVLEVYWIEIALPDGTTYQTCPFSSNFLDGMYNEAWDAPR